MAFWRVAITNAVFASLFVELVLLAAIVVTLLATNPHSEILGNVQRWTHFVGLIVLSYLQKINSTVYQDFVQLIVVLLSQVLFFFAIVFAAIWLSKKFRKVV